MTFISELILSCPNPLQIYLLHPIFGFPTRRQAGYPSVALLCNSKKVFNWTQNLKFSLGSSNSRQVQYPN